MNKNIQYEQLSRSETKMVYGDRIFKLKTRSVGVYGMGECISLFRFNTETMKDEFIVCCGWTATDNHSNSGSSKALLPGTNNTLSECKKAAEKYLESLIGLPKAA